MSRSYIVGVASIVLGGCNVERCLVVVVIAGVDFLQCNDSGNGERDGANHQRFVCNQTDGFHRQRSGDSHYCKQSGDNVPVALFRYERESVS